MKTYILTVSKDFPKTHPKAGENTNFIIKIQNELGITCRECREIDAFDGDCCGYGPGQLGNKLHTIRANYELWKKRIDDVNKGVAILSLRYWSGKPYNSKQIEFARLDNNSGCGVQKITFFDDDIECPYVYNIDEMGNHAVETINIIAKNDGLSYEDFKAWFKSYDLSKPMAIIHFTKFRY